MIIDVPYEFGQMFYIKTDTEQFERQLVGVQIVPNGVLFELAFGERTSKHYEFELSLEPDSVKRTR